VCGLSRPPQPQQRVRRTLLDESGIEIVRLPPREVVEYLSDRRPQSTAAATRDQNGQVRSFHRRTNSVYVNGPVVREIKKWARLIGVIRRAVALFVLTLFIPRDRLD